MLSEQGSEWLVLYKKVVKSPFISAELSVVFWRSETLHVVASANLSLVKILVGVQ